MTIFGITFSEAVMWLMIAGIMAILEAITMGLTCIWFVGGAVCAAIAAAVGAPVIDVYKRQIPSRPCFCISLMPTLYILFLVACACLSRLVICFFIKVFLSSDILTEINLYCNEQFYMIESIHRIDSIN